MGKIKKLIVLIFMCSILFPFFGCTNMIKQKSFPTSASPSCGKIYIYGELHSVTKIKDKEIEIWGDYYENQGLRHLFLEKSYFTAEFLNVWMKSEDDDILNQIYDDWKGVKHRNPSMKNFFVEIKSRFPETVFHGTDVGHQYHSTGKRYLDYLSKNNLKNSVQYQFAKDAIKQGKVYYRKKDDVYRENMMVANFIREFNNLNNESVMGIYGAAHIGINSLNHSKSVPSMANQLHKMYDDQLFTKDLSYLKNNPLRIDSIQIRGYNYVASYFGRENLKGFKDFEYRELWRLEDAYDDFKLNKKTGDWLPYGNYSMIIVTGQVFIVDYVKTDSTMIRKYYRSDGNSMENRPITEEFVLN